MTCSRAPPTSCRREQAPDDRPVDPSVVSTFDCASLSSGRAFDVSIFAPTLWSLPIKCLPPRQHEVLAFIVAEIGRNGMPPTRRELGAHLGIVSLNGVNE